MLANTIIFSWSAVAQGAVMKGLGLLTERPIPVTRCPRHFGIKTRTHYSAWRNSPGDSEVDAAGIRWATGQVKWLVQKGDAIMAGRETVEKYDCHWSLKASDYPLAKKKQSHRDSANGTTEFFRDIIIVASAEDEAPAAFSGISRGLSLSLPTLGGGNPLDFMTRNS